MRIGKGKLVAAAVMGGMAAVLAAGCHSSHKTSSPTKVTGGPTVGPIIDVDTDGGTVKYYFTKPAGARRVCTPQAGAKLNPDFKKAVNLIHLVDSAGKIVHPVGVAKITFDDGTFVLVKDTGSELEWSCWKDASTKEKDLVYGSDPSAFVVDPCMDKKSSQFKTDTGDTGDWYHIELK